MVGEKEKKVENEDKVVGLVQVEEVGTEVEKWIVVEDEVVNLVTRENIA